MNDRQLGPALMSATALVGFFGLFLIALKLLGAIPAPWWLVTAPLWGTIIATTLLTLAAAVHIIRKEQRNN